MQMRVLVSTALAAVVSLAASTTHAQRTAMERLPGDVLDVLAPSARVRGTAGEMAIEALPCRARPTRDMRRRIVDVAVQEWGFFGFRVVDRTDVSMRDVSSGQAPRAAAGAPGSRSGRRRSWLPAEEAARVAASIAGYWAVTPEGSWIVDRQNELWNGPDGTAARWNAPWSAAFISWVMCEAGLGTTNQFQRAVAHHTYIDQAIRARDGRAPQAAFTAYDTGETAIAPGDLLCSSRRPVYRTIAERRRQMGVGARTHCDIVVKVDEARERILAIGGNVRGVVSLKLLPATRETGQPLQVVDPEEDRPIFAHLKLRAEPVGNDALDSSATMKVFGCVAAPRTPAVLAAADAADVDFVATRC
jgi:hypothetical protein